MAKKKAAEKKFSKKTIQEKKSRKLVYIAVAAVVLILLIILLIVQAVSSGRIKEGSSVTVDYTLYLEDGKIFDTTIEEVGVSAGFENGDYTPLIFNVGSESIINGFSEELLGLREGDEKRFTLTPERAYGERLDERVRSYSRNLNITKYAYVDIQKYETAYGKNPVLNDTVEVPVFLWKFRVVRLEGEKVVLEQILNEGDILNLPGADWTAVVLSIREDYILIRQSPNVGDYMDSAGSPKSKVVRVEEDLFITDANFPLAGQTITFEVKIIDVQ